MKGIPQKKIDIPGDPGKTKPVKCIKPPPKIKDPGGVGYPDPWILHLTGTHRSNNVFRGGPEEPNSWRTVNVFFLPDLSPPKIYRGGWWPHSRPTISPATSPGWHLVLGTCGADQQAQQRARCPSAATLRGRSLEPERRPQREHWHAQHLAATGCLHCAWLGIHEYEALSVPLFAPPTSPQDVKEQRTHARKGPISQHARKEDRGHGRERCDPPQASCIREVATSLAQQVQPRHVAS